MEMKSKIIKDFNQYEVSEAGVIRKITNKKVLHQFSDDKGFISVKLKNNKDKFVRERVHILVYRTFLRNYKSGGRIVHIDGDKNNNYYKNLKFTFFKIKHDEGNIKLECDGVLVLPNGDLKINKEIFFDIWIRRNNRKFPFTVSHFYVPSHISEENNDHFIVYRQFRENLKGLVKRIYFDLGKLQQFQKFIGLCKNLEDEKIINKLIMRTIIGS